MKKKLILIGCAVLALALLAVGMLLLYNALKPKVVSGEKGITVYVVHKDRTVKAFYYNTNEEYLGTLLQAEGLIEGEEGPYGLMISKVDGELADWDVDQGYWALYIEADYATTGIDSTPIQDGVSYRLEYTIG